MNANDDHNKQTQKKEGKKKFVQGSINVISSLPYDRMEI